MQVGGVSHGFGTSRLWHDPNYEITRDYRPIPIQRGMTTEDAGLPHEDHVLPPEKRADPFTVQEAAYDVAHAQAQRGEDARKMLHGATNAAAFDAAVAARRDVDLGSRVGARDDAARTAIQKQQVVNPGMPTGNVRPQEVTPFAAGQVSQPAGTAGSTQDKDAAHAAKDARDTSQLVDAVGMGAGSVLAVAGAAKAAAAIQGASAAAATGATGAAATTVAGASQAGFHGDGEDVARTPRRGE